MSNVKPELQPLEKTLKKVIDHEFTPAVDRMAAALALCYLNEVEVPIKVSATIKYAIKARGIQVEQVSVKK